LVQTTLLFILGFLSAAFIAMAAAPAIWRRATELTRRRIEASTPLTLNEVQADKDQQRAEFAISLRKIEIKAKSLQEKLTEQRADAAVQRDNARMLLAERNAQEAELAERASQLENLKVELASREKDLAYLGTVRSELENQIVDLNAVVESRDKSINELRIDGDSRRIELVAKVTEQDQLNTRLRELNLTRKSLEEKLRQTMQDMQAAREAVRSDAKRLVDMERKTERLISQLSDRDERLERRENELARVKNSVKLALEEQNSIKRQLQTANQRNQQLERDIAKAFDAKRKQADAPSTDMVHAMKKLEDNNARLVSMVRQLSAEKEVLVQNLKNANGIGPTQTKSDAKLRSQVHELTAKIVSITADTEGANSPIPRLLQPAGKAANSPGTAAQSELPESLADRILALQKSARSS
jgi:chromosome segregation ATPase